LVRESGQDVIVDTVVVVIVEVVKLVELDVDTEDAEVALQESRVNGPVRCHQKHTRCSS